MQKQNRFEILAEQTALHQPLMVEMKKQVPGSVQYTIRRYPRPHDWMAEDAGVFKYEVTGSSAKDHVELHFCVTGNMYCQHRGARCQECQVAKNERCEEKIRTVDIISFQFTSTLLSQFIRSRTNDSFTESILSFRHTTSFAKTLPVCNRTRSVLEALVNHNYSDTLENIYVNAQTQMLLVYSMDCMAGEKEIDRLTCKFLANEDDKEKIVRAREILIQHIGEPITIKELSRKVAINECYLKKGFKELFGTTIFDFYQSQRMEHAKYLLYEKGLSVTDVSAMLGYSSISHFSTAFKKHTGLKPCELLFRS